MVAGLLCICMCRNPMENFVSIYVAFAEEVLLEDVFDMYVLQVIREREREIVFY